MRRAYFSILSVTFTALISAVVLWKITVSSESLGQIGLASIFLAAMLSHLTVIARDMFVPMFLSMATVYSPLILGIVAGWGGALGEVTTYYLGWGVAEFVRGNDDEKEDKVDGWIRRYGLWAVLLVSLTPLPDTPIVLLTGSGKLPFRKLLLVEGIGKTVYYTLGAFIGGFIFTDLKEVLGGFYASTIVFCFSLAFTFLVTWRRSRNAILRLIERFTRFLHIL